MEIKKFILYVEVWPLYSWIPELQNPEMLVTFRDFGSSRLLIFDLCIREIPNSEILKCWSLLAISGIVVYWRSTVVLMNSRTSKFWSAGHFSQFREWLFVYFFWQLNLRNPEFQNPDMLVTFRDFGNCCVLIWRYGSNRPDYKSTVLQT
jgi:hypothetical protein